MHVCTHIMYMYMYMYLYYIYVIIISVEPPIKDTILRTQYKIKLYIKDINCWSHAC